MDVKWLVLAGIALLYVLSAIFFHNTHPYKGQDEAFESKQQRRRIGIFLLVTATMLLGIVGLIQVLTAGY